MADRNTKPIDLTGARKKAAKLRLDDVAYTLVVCMDRKTAKCCNAKAMEETWRHLKKRSRQWRKEGKSTLLRVKSGCIGICKSGPIVGILPDGVWYGACTPELVDLIFDQHLDRGIIVNSHVIARPNSNDAV